MTGKGRNDKWAVEQLRLFRCARNDRSGNGMSFRFRDNVEKMAGYVPGFQPADAAAVKLNTNENPYPASPGVFAALARLDGNALRKYPRVCWDEFRKVAAQVHGVEPEMIVCGNGADELLAILVRCCCDSERPLAYPVPTYSLYPVLAEIQQCPVKEIPFGDDYQIPKVLAQAGGALTILCNPNAPTGTFVSVDKVAELAGAVGGVLAIDEAYVDFAQDNCLRLLKDFDNVVILRTMSKGYSLAGMRFGYSLSSEQIAEAMIKVKDSYNVNVATQVAATAALSDQEHFRANVVKIVAERGRLLKAMRQMGFESRDSQTNFLWVRIVGQSAKEVYEKLIERNVYVRYFDKPGLNDKLRITVGTARENDALLGALREIIS